MIPCLSALDACLGQNISTAETSYDKPLLRVILYVRRNNEVLHKILPL